MKNRILKTSLVLIITAALVIALALLTGCGNSKVPVKVLILPKFEVDEMSGDFPGEAQFYYEAYVRDGDEYDIEYGKEGSKLYVKNGVALYVTGEGKIASALSTAAVLKDDRFDFSKAFIISTGCAGSSADSTVMGDVFICSAACDYDLGHHADVRDLDDENLATWFHDSDYDESAFVILDRDLTEQVYELVKDVKLETTENTRNYMKNALPDKEWATRDPMVLKGTSVTGDNYWKGSYDHVNAQIIAATYACPDPYAVTEMEDVAIGNVLKRLGMLDRYIIIRDSVNLDVFVNGANPVNLWDHDAKLKGWATEELEVSDVFTTAMHNNYLVGKEVVNAIINGELVYNEKRSGGDDENGKPESQEENDRFIEERIEPPAADYQAENSFMQIAINEARNGIYNNDGGPFGAVIIKDGKVIGRGHNCVVKNNDSTWHGEIAAIRNAEKNINSYDLSGCVLYTTGEPCLTCLTACIWANIDHVYYGCTIEDNSEIGFRDALIDDQLGDRDGLDGYLEETDRAACLELFKEYEALGGQNY